MKILVTGGCGFIGSNYIIKQIKENHNTIFNLDNLTYAGNLDNLKSISNEQNYKFKKGDICDISFISKAINSFNPNAIVHFAAESHVDRSIDNPIAFLNTNILGTANILISILESINKLPKNFRFLHISTDEVFGSLSNDGYFTEETNYDPSSPYSASKASSDHLVRAWHKTYGIPTLITNCSNNYGPYQFPEKLIPLMILNCIDEKPLPVYGKGDNIRDWLYVDDHCNAIDAVLNNGKIGETYNVGGNNEIQNIEIVKLICEILDEIKPRSSKKSYSSLISFVPDRPGHDFRYAIDASKINEKLRWSPSETFKTGIRKTIIWYLDNLEWCRNIQNGSYSQERLGLKNV